MAKRVIGLDIGTYSVKVAHLEARARGTDFDLILYKEVLLSKFINPEVEKTEQELQLDAVKELKSLGHLEGAWLTSGLPGTDAQIRSLEVPFSNKKKIEAVLPGLMDSHLPFPVENLVYSWLSIDEKESASHLLVSFARKEAIASFLGQMRKIEVDPRYLTLKSSALFDLIAQVAPSSASADSIYCAVDIGHKSTGICVADKKNVRIARSVPKGGYHITQSLSHKLAISLEEAELQKNSVKELIEPLQEAYYPIIREVRQTILAMEAETHRKLEHIYLVGGGAKAVGLAEFMSSLLSVPVSLVDRFSQFHLVPNSSSRVRSSPKSEAGLALSYAVLGERASNREPRFNFRRDEFSFSGEFDYVRQRVKTIVAWSCVVLFLVAISGSIRNFFLTGRLERLSENQRQMCQQITGTPMDGSACLAAINAEIEQLKIPVWSSADAYVELAKAVPSSLQIKVTNLDITSDLKLKMTVQSPSLNSDADLVSVLNKNSCFHNAEKSGKKQVPGGTQFVIKTDFDCERSKTLASVQPTAPKEE